MNQTEKVAEILDVEVSIPQILVCSHEILGVLFCVSMKSFFVYTVVADGSEKSTSTISDGFSSVRVRNRPPLPQSNSGNLNRLEIFQTNIYFSFFPSCPSG
jgi:hypothetical protein